MPNDLIQDRGCGPEISGTRITVYDLLPHFLDPTATETYICQVYELAACQVSAARAYVLNNPQEVLAQHLRIEARMAEGNAPEVIATAEATHIAFLNFKKWLSERERAACMEQTEEFALDNGRNGRNAFPTFREWIAQREARSSEAS